MPKQHAMLLYIPEDKKDEFENEFEEAYFSADFDFSSHIARAPGKTGLEVPGYYKEIVLAIDPDDLDIVIGYLPPGSIYSFV